MRRELILAVHITSNKVKIPVYLIVFIIIIPISSIMKMSLLTTITQQQDGYSAVTIEVTFTNLATYFISSTYVPTFLLLIIVYLTFYFPLDDFSDRIMVCLTTLLVEAAFWTQVSS